MVTQCYVISQWHALIIVPVAHAVTINLGHLSLTSPTEQIDPSTSWKVEKYQCTIIVRLPNHLHDLYVQVEHRW